MKLSVKRALDLFFVLLCLPICLPLFIFIGLCIKLDSKGPIIYKQERLGKNGKIFKILKFRTMIDNAEYKGTGLFILEENDNRITRVGDKLRKTSLDELPQIINILAGNMSFIGPRPPIPTHPYRYESYSKKQKVRFLFLPGITGYAQVMGRNELSWDEKIIYDIKYVNNYGLFLDFKILLRTLYKLFKKEGIYIKQKAE